MGYTGEGTKENPYIVDDWETMERFAPVSDVYIKFKKDMYISELSLRPLSIRCRELDFNGLVVDKVTVSLFPQSYITQVPVDGKLTDALYYTESDWSAYGSEYFDSPYRMAVWRIGTTQGYRVIIKNGTFNNVELNTIFDIWFSYDLSTTNYGVFLPLIKNVNFYNIHSRTIIHPNVLSTDANIELPTKKDVLGAYDNGAQCRPQFFSDYNTIFDSCTIEIKANKRTPLSIPGSYFNNCIINLSTYTIDDVTNLYILTQVSYIANCNVNIDCYLSGTGTLKIARSPQNVGSHVVVADAKLCYPTNSIVTLTVFKDKDYHKKISFRGNAIHDLTRTVIIIKNGKDVIGDSGGNSFTQDSYFYNNLICMEDTQTVQDTISNKHISTVMSQERYPKYVQDFTIPDFRTVYYAYSNRVVYLYNTIPTDLIMCKDDHVNNGLPIVPLWTVPTYEESDFYRRTDIRFATNIPKKIMYNKKVVEYMCNKNTNKDYDIYWQKTFDNLLSSQVYGNYFNNTKNLSIVEDRKNIYTQYYKYNQFEDTSNFGVQLHNTSNTDEYILQSIDYGKTYTPYELLKFNNVANSGLVMSSVDHSSDELRGTNCYYTISKELLNTSNFTICVSVDNTNAIQESIHTTEGLNYLINIPVTINGESFNYYIAEDLNDSNKRYCTNINETKEKEYLNINRQLLSDTYPNSNVFIITSDTNGLHLYINGLPYSFTKLPYSITVEDIFEDSYIGYYDGQNISNNYNGVLLSVHVFSECCEDSKVWKLFNDVKTELYTPTEPVDTTPIPTKLIVTRYPNTYSYYTESTLNMTGTEFCITKSDGTRIAVNLENVNVSVSPTDTLTTISNMSQNIIYCLYDYEGVTYRTTIPIQLRNKYVATITLLDENHEPTETTESFTTFTSAGTRLKALITSDPSNLYHLHLSDNISEINVFTYFKSCTNIYSLHISNSIVSLPTSCFSYCSNLVEVTIPDTITDTQAQCFEYCTKLKKVTWGRGSTSIPSKAFYNCTSLQEVILPDNLQSMGGSTFENCTSLQTISIPDSMASCVNTTFRGTPLYNSQTNIIYIDKWLVSVSGSTSDLVIRDGTIGIASNCCASNTTLVRVTMPSSVRYLGVYCFDGCTKLKTIEMSPNIECIFTYAFRNCSALEEITLSSKLCRLTGETFTKCSSLTTINMPDFWGVQSIPASFINNCTALTSLSIPEGTVTINTLNMANVKQITFPQSLKNILGTITCNIEELYLPRNLNRVYSSAIKSSSLRKVDLSTYPNYDTLGYRTTLSFLSDATIEEFIASDNNPAVSTQDGILYNKDKTIILKYPPARQDETFTIPDYVTSLDTSAFRKVVNLKTVYIGRGITTWTKNSYFDNSSIENIYIPATMTNVPDITYLFSSAKNLKNIFVDSDNSIYSDIDGILYNKEGTSLIYYPLNSEITNYVMPEGVTTITKGLANNTNVLSVTTPSSLTTIPDNLFYNNKSITTITLNDSVDTLSSSAFYYCTALQSIKLSTNVTSIPTRAFSNCTALTSITGMDGLTEIGDYAFEYCSAIPTLSLPEGLVKINTYAFRYCSVITTIEIPSSVTTIGSNAFYSCSKLTRVNINKPSGSISGAAWGLSKMSYVYWLG